MTQNVLAEYRNLYRDRHGIECPLSDAQLTAALTGASIDLNKYPFDKETALTAIEASVTSNFPSVDQNRWKEAGTLQAGTLTLDNPTDEGFDANFTAAHGGNSPYSYQLQIGEEEDDLEDHGSPQATTAEIVVTGLDPEVEYFARVKVTDNRGEEAFTDVESLETSASG